MMARSTIDRLIVNPPLRGAGAPLAFRPHDPPVRLAPGRRPAGYVVASEDSRTFDDRRSQRLAFYGADP